jgi:chaperonin GroEL
VIVGKILEKDQYNFGFDAQNGEYGNLVTKGIIDPTKVVRAALPTMRSGTWCATTSASPIWSSAA